MTDPIRGVNGQFLLIDPWSANYFDLEEAKFMEPIGLEHFFDAFSLDGKRPLKVRQGLIASSAMQQKKKIQTLAVFFLFCVVFWVWGVCCFVVFLFPVLQVFWNPEFSAQFRPR